MSCLSVYSGADWVDNSFVPLRHVEKFVVLSCGCVVVLVLVSMDLFFLSWFVVLFSAVFFVCFMSVLSALVSFVFLLTGHSR